MQPQNPIEDYDFDVAYFVSEFLTMYKEGKTRYIQNGSKRCETFLKIRGHAPNKRGLSTDDRKSFSKLMDSYGFKNSDIWLVDVVLGIPLFRKSKGIYRVTFDFAK